MDCAFKAVEDVRYSAQSDLKCLVVVVAANFTDFHWSLLRKTQPSPREVLREDGSKIVRGWAKTATIAFAVFAATAPRTSHATAYCRCLLVRSIRVLCF